MQLVATKKATGKFFRAQTIGKVEQIKLQISMTTDAGEDLNFQTMTDAEFDDWLISHS